ncbi:non-hydrolyzing UDP-N-acetylglucosamine 2-epimerase [Dietzia sp. UCD-THP]|uniref:non-hydrolyzing UDP-N-acetylglucosamine 2-epimerase n=1 Tax=Dietzia sp. UCD-THP TaxID=1292020 RepID=UPI001930AA8A|nr:UDP-N-acetylglucosamine 2-epimerase (non-hydrolyzing) [Dietzia sp. UCD-THP]
MSSGLISDAEERLLMKKVALVYGTRPEAIKMAPLVKELNRSTSINVTVLVTGQHREMLHQVNELFSINPHVDLDIMSTGASLSDMTSLAVKKCGAALAEVGADAVVVQGDTTSAFAGALAAFYNRQAVVHLEAGLRTWDMGNPYPEEANRRLISPLSSLHLAPTQVSKSNLEREGVDASTIVVTGNTVIDALFEGLDVPNNFVDPAVRSWSESSGRRLLVTTHRRESWGEPMRDAMTAVRDAAFRVPDLNVLVPMHRNAIVRNVLEAELSEVPNVSLVEPLDYHDFVHVQNKADVILTDSGGVQEEAPSLGVPVLVMRSSTERPEAVDAGTVRLVGTKRATVYGELCSLLLDRDAWQRMSAAINPYGDGRAAARAAAAIHQLLGVGERIEEFRP